VAGGSLRANSAWGNRRVAWNPEMRHGVAQVMLPTDPDIKGINDEMAYRMGSPVLLDGSPPPSAYANMFSEPSGYEVMREILGTGRNRPKSAVYVPRQCREHRPGAGGSPLPTNAGKHRPHSARPGSARAGKIEQWREVGRMRWPDPPPHEYKKGPPQDSTPFHQTVQNAQQNWKHELWIRSLRKPGVLIQDPVYATPGAEIQQMHEEWRSCPPVSAGAVAYSGATVSGRVAIPREQNSQKWVERPVAAGKYALAHMDGNRYKFDNNPRFYATAESPAPPTPQSARRSTPPATSRQWRAKLCKP